MKPKCFSLLCLASLLVLCTWNLHGQDAVLEPTNAAGDRPPNAAVKREPNANGGALDFDGVSMESRKVELKHQTARAFELAYNDIFHNFGCDINSDSRHPMTIFVTEVRPVKQLDSAAALVEQIEKLDHLRVLKIYPKGRIVFLPGPSMTVQAIEIEKHEIADLIRHGENVLVQVDANATAVELSGFIKELRRIGAKESVEYKGSLEPRPPAEKELNGSSASAMSDGSPQPDGRSSSKKLRDAEQKGADIAKQIRTGNVKPDGEQIPHLRREVEAAFEARQQLQQVELKKLRKQLDRIEQLVSDREQLKDKIIDRRVEELIASNAGRELDAQSSLPTGRDIEFKIPTDASTSNDVQADTQSHDFELEFSWSPRAKLMVSMPESEDGAYGLHIGFEGFPVSQLAEFTARISDAKSGFVVEKVDTAEDDLTQWRRISVAGSVKSGEEMRKVIAMLMHHLTIDELRIDLPKTNQRSSILPSSELFRAIKVMRFALEPEFSDGVANGVYFSVDGHRVEQPLRLIEKN